MLLGAPGRGNQFQPLDRRGSQLRQGVGVGFSILHPFFGYTKSSVKEAVFQIGAKNFILFALIDAEPRMQEKPVVFYLFIIYTAIELIKYPYYMLRTYDIDFIPITW